MATTRKVLGQVAPSATTDTTLYTVPAATSTVCSSLVVANRGEVTALVRVAVRVAGAACCASRVPPHHRTGTSQETVSPVR